MRSRLFAVLAAFSLGVIVSGCGGSSGEGVANPGSTQTPTMGADAKREAALAYSACMRRNGVPRFPDPVTEGRGMRISLGPGSGIDPNSPTYKNAERTCRRLLPNGGVPTPQEQARLLSAALAYARCMRQHGVPEFPDPKVSGNGLEWGELGPRTGADPRSPQFEAAVATCNELVPDARFPVQVR
jgi:hypothetical protein